MINFENEIGVILILPNLIQNLQLILISIIY